MRGANIQTTSLHGALNQYGPKAPVCTRQLHLSDKQQYFLVLHVDCGRMMLFCMHLWYTLSPQSKCTVKHPNQSKSANCIPLVALSASLPLKESSST